MIGIRGVSIFCFPLAGLLLTASIPAFSQPLGGEMDQMQMAQSTQGGQQQGSQTSGQQQGWGGQQGKGFEQRQGQQSGQMQTIIIQRLKELMGSTDDEWMVIGPKVLAVYTLVSAQTRGIQMRTLMGNSSQVRGGTNNQSSSSASDKTLEELQTLLSSEDTTTTQLKNKISEVRKANEDARQKLAKAQKELRELLSLKQEAILISVGLLE